MLHITELNSPVTVVWEITDNCNFKCPHCRAAFEVQHDDEVLENRIIDELISNGVMSVNLSGGEPLLNNRIGNIVDRLVSSNIDTGISCNGWFFEKKGVELIKRGLSFLQVSVDGPQELHDGFRGVRGAYSRALHALEIGKKHKVRTQMNVTITSLNLDTLEYNIEIAKKLEIDRVFFRRIIPTGLGELNSHLLPEKAKYIERIKSIMSICEDSLDIAIDDPIVTVLNRTDNVIGCTAGIKSIGITSDGSVYPCIFLRNKIGNLRYANLNTIWKNDKILRALRNREDGECSNCKHKFSCGGCKAYSGVFNRDEMCPIY